MWALGKFGKAILSEYFSVNQSDNNYKKKWSISRDITYYAPGMASEVTESFLNPNGILIDSLPKTTSKFKYDKNGNPKEIEMFQNDLLATKFKFEYEYYK